jgi:transcriptional accessory protein Tex/SPT6
MASNPPYTLSNKSNSIVFFGINHNDNYLDSFAIKPGDYFVFDTIDKGIEGKFYLSDDLEKDRLTNDLFAQVGKTLTLTDKDGNVVTADQYKTDNPDS